MQTKYFIILLLTSLILSGCVSKVVNYYVVIGTNNDLHCENIIAPEKTIGTSMGAALSGTAALSQGGTAANSGESTATNTVPKSVK